MARENIVQMKNLFSFLVLVVLITSAMITRKAFFLQDLPVSVTQTEVKEIEFALDAKLLALLFLIKLPNKTLKIYLGFLQNENPGCSITELSINYFHSGQSPPQASLS